MRKNSAAVQLFEAIRTKSCLQKIELSQILIALLFLNEYSVFCFERCEPDERNSSLHLLGLQLVHVQSLDVFVPQNS